MHKICVAAAALVWLLDGAAVYAGKDCTIAVKGTSPVVAACKEGGIVKAKTKMRELTKAARPAMRVDCEDCHKNLNDYALSDNARKDFDKLLRLAAKAPR